MAGMRRFEVEYYGAGRFVKSVVVLAKSKADALAKIRAECGVVLEVICVRNLDEF